MAPGNKVITNEVLYISLTSHKPVTKTAEKPVFWTVLSLLNVTRNVFPSDVIVCGRAEPQKDPCTFESTSKPLRISTESYSQSCCSHHIITPHFTTRPPR